MSTILDRLLENWKTTAGGVLAVAGVIVSSLTTGYPSMKWCPIATAIVAGLTGLLAKDK